MLRIDLQELRRGPVRTDGTIPPDHAAFEGIDGRFEEGLQVSGVLSTSVDGNHVWQSRLRGVYVGPCRRCLEEARSVVEVEVRAVFSANPDVESDPTVYPLFPASGVVDLTEAVREEVSLAAPPFPLCREECQGLCAGCGVDLNAGACRCALSDEPESR